MKHVLLAALTLGAAPCIAAPAHPLPPTLCRVTATVTEGRLLDKRLTIRQRPGCNGVAHLRFASSLGGSVPDSPPGWETLYPNQLLTRETPNWWWAEWRDRIGRWWRVPESSE